MQILGIPFRTIPWKRTKLGIPFRATKIEIYSRNAVPNHSVGEKPTQNKMRQLIISINVAEKMIFEIQTNYLVKLFCCCFVKLIFSAEFHSVPFRPSFGIVSSAELGMPRNECFLPQNNGTRSESIPRNFFGAKFRSQP